MQMLEFVCSMLIVSRYFCTRCKKWKGKELYSNKQLRQYQWNKAEDNRLNGITAKLSCSACSQQVHERQCEGHCGEWKPLDEFSKVQRSAGGSGVSYCPKAICNTLTKLSGAKCVSIGKTPPNQE